MYPKLVVSLKDIEKNAKTIVKKLKKENITVSAVTKVFLANEEMVNSLIKAGVDFLADSRIQNLKRLNQTPLQKWLIRMPMKCEIAEVT